MFPQPKDSPTLEWLAFLENMLTRNDDVEGGQGTILVHVGTDWWTLRWRTDDGVHPAVVAATL